MSHRWNDRKRYRHDHHHPVRGGGGSMGGERANYSHEGRGRGGGIRNDYNNGYNIARSSRDDGYNNGHVTSLNRSSQEPSHTNRYPPAGNNNSRYQERGRYGQSHGGYRQDGPGMNQPPRAMPNANQNNGRNGDAQQPVVDMIVDKLPGEEASETNGNEEPRPDSPQSTVDDSIPFAEKEYKDQLIAQIPDTEHDVEEFKRKLPVEALNPRTKAGLKPHLNEWKHRKDKAAAKVVEEMKRLEDFQDDFDDSDDDDSYVLIHRASLIKEKEATLSNFILALPTCHLLTIGFDYSGDKREEKCFCPCNQEQTRKWRNFVGVVIGDGECKGRNSKRFKTPNALVAHLKSMPKCPFHKYALRYLEELYRDWHVSKNLKHKGLYIENTKDYMKAVEEEKHQRDRLAIVELGERDKELHKIRAVLEELKLTNAEQVKNYKAELQSREAVLTKLGVDFTNIEDTLPPSASDMFPKHKAKYEKFLAWVRLSYGVESKKSDDRTIQVKQNFCLRDVFEMWSKYPNECFGGILFRDFEDNEDVKHLLSAWTIEYSAVDALQGAESDVEEDFKAVDAGGPEEQFAENLWANLLGLEVLSPDGKKSLPLFEETEHGIQPVGDERFQSVFGKNTDPFLYATSRAKLYYRAIGRFAAHCLCRGRPLPNHLVPKLLWNAVLRDCKPTDPQYSSLDLGLHVLGIGWKLDVLEETKKICESPNDFRELIEETYISSNTIWLDGFSQGLLVVRSAYCPDKDCVQDLECFPVDATFSPFSLETVETLILATRQYSANDLLSKLVPVYSDDCDNILRETQEKLFCQGLRDILIKWEKEDPMKLPQFVQFCSGRSFLSTDPGSYFKIKVAFEIQTVEENSSSPARLPESHTCESQLSLPSEAYDGDVEVLEEKLTKALEYHNLFTMG